MTQHRAMNDGDGDSTTQQLLTILVQSTAELNQSTAELQQSTAELQQSTAELQQSNKQQNQKIDLLTNQMGYLTEVVTTGFAELKELAQQQSETAKRQEQNITRLVGIVEALVQQRP